MMRFLGLRSFARLQDKLAVFVLRRMPSLSLGSGVVVRGWPEIECHEKSNISIGNNVVLCSRSGDTALGVSRPVILRTLMPGAEIHIANDAGLSGTVICAASKVSIGPNALIGSEVIIADTDFHPIHGPETRRKAPLPIPASDHAVEIGADVFVGARSIILKGSIIGEGSVVGAGSVVTGTFPARSIIAGNPARVIGNVRDAL